MHPHPTLSWKLQEGIRWTLLNFDEFCCTVMESFLSSNQFTKFKQATSSLSLSRVLNSRALWVEPLFTATNRLFHWIFQRPLKCHLQRVHPVGTLHIRVTLGYGLNLGHQYLWWEFSLFNLNCATPDPRWNVEKLQQSVGYDDTGALWTANFSDQRKATCNSPPRQDIAASFALNDMTIAVIATGFRHQVSLANLRVPAPRKNVFDSNLEMNWANQYNTNTQQ